MLVRTQDREVGHRQEEGRRPAFECEILGLFFFCFCFCVCLFVYFLFFFISFVFLFCAVHCPVARLSGRLFAQGCFVCVWHDYALILRAIIVGSMHDEKVFVHVWSVGGL